MSRWDSDIAAARELCALHRDELRSGEDMAPKLMRDMALLGEGEVTAIENRIAESVRSLNEEIDRTKLRWPALG